MPVSMRLLEILVDGDRDALGPIEIIQWRETNFTRLAKIPFDQPLKPVHGGKQKVFAFGHHANEISVVSYRYDPFDRPGSIFLKSEKVCSHMRLSQRSSVKHAFR